MQEKELEIEKQFKALFSWALDGGFCYEYTYEKGGDSSCSYIYRFKKGRDFFDLRELSGGIELNFVVYKDGQYRFPNLKARYPKQFRSFKFKHLFKAPTRAQRREFYAELLKKEWEATDFFGFKT